MADFVPASEQRVNAFRLGETVFFRHYFDSDAVFATLRPFYDNYHYRFEVPETEFPRLRELLGRHGYRLVIVDDPTPFVVVVRKYTAHPDSVFTSTVLRRSVGDHTCFLLADLDAVEAAVAEGATKLVETGVAVETVFGDRG